jgi:hypothetical protein
MTHQTKSKEGNRIVELMYEAIQETLKKHMPGNQPLVMDPVGPRLPIYRKMTNPLPSRSRRPETITVIHLQKHRLIKSFQDILREAIDKVLQDACVSSWTSTVLAFSVVSQCRLAGRLLEQLGCKNKGIINIEKIPSNFDTTAAQCFASIQQSQLPITEYITVATESLRQKMNTCTRQKDTMKLRFVLTDSTICVEWLTDDGKVVKKELFRDFIYSIMGSISKKLSVYINHLKTAQTSHNKIGETVLREVSPKLFDTVHHACQEKRYVGIHLHTSKDRRGIPLDVWLYLNPTLQALKSSMGNFTLSLHWLHHDFILGAMGNCTLSVHRPHRDFILGAKDGSRYYFPPCLLTARVTYSYNRYQVLAPTVRQPCGGYNWNHPYTGPLGNDPFFCATLNGNERDVMYEPSDEALKLFPELANRTYQARENNLCLPDQSRETTKLQSHLHKENAGLHTLDVLGVITALHQLARVGLTRGHQNNTSGPRSHLAPDSMPYPLRGRQVYGRLAKRVFVYNPVW